MSPTAPKRSRKKIKKPISIGSEWDFDLLKKYDQAIAEIASDYSLDTYPNQIEVISADQMLTAYSSVGMPIGYNHWSFGKHFVVSERNYRRGAMGLAYEIVINSNPCIAYLMEENSVTMQALVIAHACYGHNSFFKGNYLFRNWTNADSIIDYLLFAKNYITACEEQYGLEMVESTLDACHALMNHGVDRYKRPPKLSLQEEKVRQQVREEYLQFQVNDLWKTIPQSEIKKQQPETRHFPEEPQENLLYFIEKNAPLLEPWQREIVRIVRKIAQYFYPQRQTQVMNEGWACFWHYRLINDLYDQGLVTDEFMMEFLKHHTNVIFQPTYDTPYYSGINPYALGFNMMMDIRRVCESPTDEDRFWFPDIAGKNWLTTLKFAMKNFKDESFIAQYLSPKMMRDLKLFAIFDDDKESELEVAAIHDETGYAEIRRILANQYNLGNLEPNIQIYDVNLRGDRSLSLRHYSHNRRLLIKGPTEEVMKHLYQLWGFPIKLDSIDIDDKIITQFEFPLSTQQPKT